MKGVLAYVVVAPLIVGNILRLAYGRLRWYLITRRKGGPPC